MGYGSNEENEKDRDRRDVSNKKKVLKLILNHLKVKVLRSSPQIDDLMLIVTVQLKFIRHGI